MHWTLADAKSTSKSVVKVPPFNMEAPDDVTNPMKMLRDFDYGTLKQENGRTIREFQLTAGTSIIKLNSAVSYNIWDLNGRIPGPTLRAKQGDRIRIRFLNNAEFSFFAFSWGSSGGNGWCSPNQQW